MHGRNRFGAAVIGHVSRFAAFSRFGETFLKKKPESREAEQSAAKPGQQIGCDRTTAGLKRKRTRKKSPVSSGAFSE